MFHNTFNIKTLLLLASATFVFASCLKDPTTVPPTAEPARARIEITDAPVDDPNVKGVFVTVVDIKVDGKSWDGFDGKTTFDLLAYQQGQTKLLGEGELDAKTYSEVVLVLDTETDANGDAPGCYVKDASGVKRKLNGGSEMNIKVKGSFETKADQTTEAVVDLDLRKAIIYQTGSSTEFQFVTNAELQTAARLVDKAQTGNISGNCSDGVSGSDKVVVYVYKKGEFDASVEKFEQGASQIQFKNAISSSLVASNGAFDLTFLESGTYELHFISYKEDAAGKLQAKGELQLSLVGSTLNLLGLNVTADTTIDLDLMVSGILFF